MKSTKQFIPVNEMRRKAPLHFWAKADNSRFTAFLMNENSKCDEQLANEIGYEGASSIARSEAFRREAAISLELIIKAAIAQRIEAGESSTHVSEVRTSHDIPKLWEEAGLASLSNRDKRLLLLARKILLWSGRYAAPKDDQKYQKEIAEDEALKTEPRTALGIFKIEKSLMFEWDDFNRLYQMAFAEFNRARAKLHSNFGDFE